jgi:hypothetical protein
MGDFGAYMANVADTWERRARKAESIVNAPLSPDEMRLVDKHCDWVAFQHAWNAIMKRRRELLSANGPSKEG